MGFNKHATYMTTLEGRLIVFHAVPIVFGREYKYVTFTSRLNY